MSDQSMTEAKRQRITTAVHEAGHAVAAVMAGARIMAVTLHSDPKTPGSCTFVDLPAGKDAAVAYAGPWCEARLRFGARPRLEHIQAAIAANPGDHSDLAEYGPPLPRDTESLLETCWSTIVKLAATLYAEGRLAHRDVTAALGIPLLNGHLSTEASMIRSGCEPGSFTCHQPGTYSSG
ncbi:M50 family metallopeptidase [Prescottella equi]|uniref:M50 family metallopeptidase n=1 Tax=Rhodococcus hoagii TaxID=43767 RepID=UPI000A106BF3|nr:M50 family metallopeptidase [Prescottella equi]ORL76409.1 hypothetical protein A5N71_16350 [Prescottella equi]